MRTPRLRIAVFGFVTFLLIVISGLAQRGAQRGRNGNHWIEQSPMSAAREGACAVQLPEGTVLIAGGADGNGKAQATAELFTAEGKFAAVSSMSSARSQAACVMLPSGAVLVAGGIGVDGSTLSSTEIFDPKTGHWYGAGRMTIPRAGATASPTADGHVLIAGGRSFGAATSSLELFDIVSRTFSPVNGAMSSPRQQHAAANLPGGRVLIAGGSDGSRAVDSLDIYDPAIQATRPAGKMSTPRQGHSATTLPDGRVLIAGGNNGSVDLASAEIFDPARGAVQTVGPMNFARQGHLAFLLPKNNQVLLVGGTAAGAELTAAEVFAPWSASFQPIDSLSVPRAQAVGGVAKRGLLVAGGASTKSVTVTAEALSYATVTTDQTDYPPGSTVTITGSGWQPGETVQLLLHEVPMVEADVTLTAVADPNGNISNSQFMTDGLDIGVTFYLTATGLQSGLQAQTTFTDGVYLTTAILNPSTPTTTVQEARGPVAVTTYIYGKSPVSVATNAPSGYTCSSVTFYYGTTNNYGTGTGEVNTFLAGPVLGTTSFSTQFSTPPVGGPYFIGGIPSGCSTTVANSDFAQLLVNASISGIVYTDVNENGMYDAGIDTPLAGVKITLGSDQATSAADGSYTLTNGGLGYGPGTYTLSAPGAVGNETFEVSSTPPPANVVTGGTNITGENFGYVPPSSMSLTKTANPSTYSKAGDVITYTYTITNTGTANLKAPFTVTDDHITGGIACGSTDLGPGGSTTCTAKYTITQNDVDTGAVTNTANATAGDGTKAGPAMATVTSTAVKTLSLTKTALPSTYSKAGDVITYTYTISNPGTVTVKAPFTVTDDHITGGIACGTTDLAPGGSTTCTAKYTITQTDVDTGKVTNVANATAGDGTKAGPATATVTSTATKTISLVKTASPTTYSTVGTLITYTYKITNSGNITLAGPLSISDNKLGTISPCGSGPLAPGSATSCTAAYMIKQSDIDNGSITNIATASGNGVSSNQATATVTASVVVNNGPITTYTQGGWGTAPHGNNPGALLSANFGTVFGAAGVTIGGGGGYTLTFTSQPAVEAFLPQGSTPGVLKASATNPTSSSAGVFAGQVLALQLSVSFSKASVTGSGLANLIVQSGVLKGDTVQQVLTLANSVLGGGPLPAGLTVSGLNDIVDSINNSFDGGKSNGYVK